MGCTFAGGGNACRYARGRGGRRNSEKTQYVSTAEDLVAVLADTSFDGEVILTANIALPQETEVEMVSNEQARAVRLDLNGNALYLLSGFRVARQSHLTLLDSDGTGEIALLGGKIANSITNWGTLILDGIKIRGSEHTLAIIENYPYAVLEMHSGSVYNANRKESETIHNMGGTFEMSGGAIYTMGEDRIALHTEVGAIAHSPSSVGPMTIWVPVADVVKITGGYIESFEGYGMSTSQAWDDVKSEISITGGFICGKKGAFTGYYMTEDGEEKKYPSEGKAVWLQTTEKAEVYQQYLTYSDVAVTDWFYTAVMPLAYRGILTDYGDGAFHPTATMTRAMLVTVLYRMSGATDAGTPTFADVPANTWYTNAVAWAEKNNIVNGTGETTFSPSASVTREQLATIMQRYSTFAGKTLAATDAAASSFADYAQVSTYAKEAMDWAVSVSLISGKENNRLDPQGTATRAEVATILTRYPSAA